MQGKRDTLHPRPQFTRPLWYDLCGSWGFAYDDARQGLSEQWQEREDVYTRTIQVPFPPESSASGIGDPSFHPVVWYRRSFQVAQEASGNRLLLHFGAVDYRAQVWVNGQLVAIHEGGHTPFSADITSALREKSEQVIVVRAEDDPLDLAQPRGKQDWHEQPHSIWYHRTTGIWQPVWLEPVAATHIARVRWTPDLERGLLACAITLHQQEQELSQALQVRVRLSLRGLSLCDDTYAVQGSEVLRQIAVDQVSSIMDANTVLWSPGHPNLLDATLTLLRDNEVVDEVQSYVGLRNIGVGNGLFLLNGRPYYLRFALEQGYWPQSHLAAPSDEAMRREVELAKALGFNGVRIHQKVEDPRFLYWCDRLGLLVWGEIANAYLFSPTSVERLIREWLEVLERDYSHPCIVAWVPLNESWGVPNLAHDAAQQHFVQALYHMTKALDPTRPMISNDGWEHTVTDILGIHDYVFEGATLMQRYGSAEAIERTLRDVQPEHHLILLPIYHRQDEPIMLTEVGGISYQPKPDESWFGYGTVKDSESYLAKYRELIDAILNCPMIAGFCYTQLTDTGQETNGLLTENRESKLDVAAVHAITTRPPGAVPADEIDQIRQAEEQKRISKSSPSD